METYTALRGLSYSWHYFKNFCLIWLLQCGVLDEVGIQVLSRLSWVHQSDVPLSVDLPLHCNTIFPLDPFLFRFLKEVRQLMMCWVTITALQHIHNLIHSYMGGRFQKIKMQNFSFLKLNSWNSQTSPIFFTTHSHLHLHQFCYEKQIILFLFQYGNIIYQIKPFWKLLSLIFLIHIYDWKLGRRAINAVLGKHKGKHILRSYMKNLTGERSWKANFGNIPIMYLAEFYYFISPIVIVPVIFSLISMADSLHWASWSNI